MKLGPRKRRTRQHVIADQGVHFVEGLILDQGHTAERIFRDYGYDLAMATYDSRGYVEPGCVLFQVKAAEVFKVVKEEYPFDIDIRDYNLWVWEQSPVILILYDASLRQGHWQDIQAYFGESETRRPRKGAKSVRVFVPVRQRLTPETIGELRRRKSGGQAS